MDDSRLKAFRFENGPFNDGLDEFYVLAVGTDDAKQVAKRLDDFTPASREEVDAIPNDAPLFRADERRWFRDKTVDEVRVR